MWFLYCGGLQGSCWGLESDLCCTTTKGNTWKTTLKCDLLALQSKPINIANHWLWWFQTNHFLVFHQQQTQNMASSVHSLSIGLRCKVSLTPLMLILLDTIYCLNAVCHLVWADQRDLSKINHSRILFTPTHSALTRCDCALTKSEFYNINLLVLG